MTSIRDICPAYIGKLSQYLDIEKEIASGSYGKVYKARTKPAGVSVLDLPDGVVALKAQRISEDTEAIINETSILRSLKIPNVPKFYGCFTNETVLYIIMEYLPGKDLFDSLGYLSHSDCVSVLFKIATTLDALHKARICHRDIKLENIMYNRGEPYLIDFGLSCLDKGCAGIAGTPLYVDPLLLINKEPTFEDYVRNDWWGFLILSYTVFAKQYPYGGDTYLKMNKGKFNYKKEYESGTIKLNLEREAYVPKALMKIFRKCIEEPYNVLNRPTGEQLISLLGMEHLLETAKFLPEGVPEDF
jgi:serine/threonine protein kinase